MKTIPTQEKNPKGLHQRYIVSKTDGEPVDDFAEYFVLRLDEGGNDIKHIKACRKAIRTYAKKIKNHLPQLSQDLLERYPKIKGSKCKCKKENNCKCKREE